MASIRERETSRGTRYDVRVRAPGGGVRTRTFTNKTDARKHANTSEADKVRGSWSDPRDAATPFAAVAEAWTSSNPAKRPSAIARDRSILDNHLLPVLGTQRVSTITTPDIRKLVNGWSKAGAKPRTVKRQFGTLRAIMNFALDAGMISRSPCRGVKLPAAAPLDRPIIDADALERLVDALGPRYGLMAVLGAVAGLRWGEVAGLRSSDVDVEAGTIAIAQQVTRSRELGPPKSHAGRRTLAVPRGVIAALPESDHELLFPSPGGRPLDYPRWRAREWIPATRAAGIAGLTFHDLRRANATALVAAGTDLKTAQSRLGHSDVRLTIEVYASATTEADRDAADAVGLQFLARDRRAMSKRKKEESPGRNRG